jgi:hypothetical protein
LFLINGLLFFSVISGFPKSKEDLEKQIDERYKPYLEEIKMQMTQIVQERLEVSKKIDQIEDKKEACYFKIARQGGRFLNAFWEVTVFVAVLYGLNSKSQFCLQIVLMSPFCKAALALSGCYVAGLDFTAAVYPELLSINLDYLAYVLVFITLDHQNVAHVLSRVFGTSVEVSGVLILLYYFRIFKSKSQMLQNKKKKKTKLEMKKLTVSKKYYFRLQVTNDCFYHACLYGHSDVVRQLIAENKIDHLNIEPHTGYTGFHLACAGGHLSIVHQLMNKFGKDLCNGLTSTDGKTGLELSAENGQQCVVHTILISINNRNMR